MEEHDAKAGKALCPRRLWAARVNHGYKSRVSMPRMINIATTKERSWTFKSMVNQLIIAKSMRGNTLPNYLNAVSIPNSTVLATLEKPTRGRRFNPETFSA